MSEIHQAGRCSGYILVSYSGGVRFDPGRDIAILAEGFRGFPHPLHTKTSKVPRLGNDRLPPKPIQLIAHLSNSRQKLYRLSTGSFVK
jgi:hypothetical protein